LRPPIEDAEREFVVVDAGDPGLGVTLVKAVATIGNPRGREVRADIAGDEIVGRDPVGDPGHVDPGPVEILDLASQAGDGGIELAPLDLESVVAPAENVLSMEEAEEHLAP
jgi:hypothetical protein